MSDKELVGRKWLLKEKYGTDAIPADENYEAFIKAVLICAKRDGVISPEERDWVAGRAAARNQPGGYELAKTYEANETLADVINQAPSTPPSIRNVPNLVLYVAIQACSADKDYDAKEQEAIRELAQQLSVSSETVTQLEKLYEEESQIRDKRIKLLFPHRAS